MSTVIRVYNSSDIQSRAFDGIAAALRGVYSVPVTVANVSLNLDDLYDSGRDQYNSTALLAKILSTFDTRNNKSIVVVDVDLFIPVLTFVYGEAQLDGHAAVVSAHRLKNQYYGLPLNDRLMISRLEKEIVHEVGHTYGLYHCRDYECVMKSSTYVEEIDLKKAYPCPECRRILSGAIGKPA